VASPEAKNLEAISRAIGQHNRNCPYPAAEVRMNPFEVERLGWEEIRGLPVVPDAEIGTGRFRIVCSRDLGDAGLEETEAVGRELETLIPMNNQPADCRFEHTMVCSNRQSRLRRSRIRGRGR
jgi:hypothetical protein